MVADVSERLRFVVVFRRDCADVGCRRRSFGVDQEFTRGVLRKLGLGATYYDVQSLIRLNYHRQLYICNALESSFHVTQVVCIAINFIIPQIYATPLAKQSK